MITETSQALAIVAKRMGADLLPEDARYSFKMQIKSASGPKLYVVAQTRHDTEGDKEFLPAGTWTCSCPGWKMKKPGKPRGCKHLTTMQPLLEAAAREAVRTFTKGNR